MTAKRISLLLSCAFIVFLTINACKHKPTTGPSNEYGGFPDGVGKIFTSRCATSGCHNAASYTGAGGLLLDSWEHLFDGGNNGAAVIAYSPEYSSLLYFINTDTSNGDLIAEPRMPDDGSAPLTREEYNTIKKWIADGAPDRNGNIPFGSNADTRQKIYLTQQACDLMAVIDADKKVVMRYIKLGGDPNNTEAPHNTHVDANGQYCYVSFSAGNFLQKINTTSDKVESQVNLTENLPISASWNVFCINPTNNKILVSNWLANGGVASVNPATMQRTAYYGLPLIFPHGIASNATGDVFYITAEKGNALYKLTPNSQSDFKIDTLVADNNPPRFLGAPNALEIHEVIMTPDYSKLLITCQRSNEVRIIDVQTRKVLAAIPSGTYPQEITLSRKHPYAYVTCMNDAKAKSVCDSCLGSVMVINYETNEKVFEIVGKFSQPHGVAVDDRNDVLYIASQNTNGPAPHHPTSCGSRNGYYQIFSSVPPFNQLNKRTYEVSAQPYSFDVRFKN